MQDCVMPRVLIVEDDEIIADGMARHLRAAGSSRTGSRAAGRPAASSLRAA
jgi:hypothetical protein